MFDAIKIDPIAFTIPLGENGFPIYWYAILITLGIAIGTWWASKEIEKRKESSDEFFNGLIIALFTGFLFARLWYVFQDAIMAGNRANYPTLLSIINIRAGGANILGGFIGAGLAAVLYLRWRKLPIWHYADVAGPALLIAQALGRWGNFINQELYGPPTGTSWGLLIDGAHRIVPYNDLATYPLATTRFHPTFLYESLWLGVGAIALIWLNNRFRDEWAPGTLFGAFMLWWGGGRAWVELFRPDQPGIGGGLITYSMLLSLGIALFGVYVMLQRSGRWEEVMARFGLTPAARRRRKRAYKPKAKNDVK